MRVTSTVTGAERLRGLVARLGDAAAQAIDDEARDLPRQITEAIRDGVDVDGRPLPGVSRETARRKGSSRPGVEEGVLADPSQWSVATDSAGVRVYSPPSRGAAINAMESRGASLTGWTERNDANVRRRFDEAVRDE